MKLLRIISRQFRDACKSVFRNFSLSIASISCISITLILVGISVILQYNVSNFASKIEGTMTITVFMERDVDDGVIESTKVSLESMDNVEKYEYLSKTQIKSDLEGDSTILGQVISSWDEDANPLQDEFIVYVKDVEKIGDTAKMIGELDSVDIVKYGEEMIDKLVSTFNVIRNMMVAVVIGLIIVTAFLISNTIKITINSRKREIAIRRLVGASNMYIKTPFFFEGILIGIFGSVIPILLCGYGYMFAYKKLEGHLFTPIIPLVTPGDLIVDVVLLILIIAVVVGSVGSYRAVKRYLKI